jgi:coproporphyrinogen III oxidase
MSTQNDFLERRKEQARLWFEQLQRDLIAEMEKLEDECLGPFDVHSQKDPGRFEISPWQRTDHTGEPGGGDFGPRV